MMGTKKHKAPNSNLNESIEKTPRGGEKKKNARPSVLGDNFKGDNKSLLFKVMVHTDDDDGWMQVRPKERQRKSVSRNTPLRTFSGVLEEDLHSSKGHLDAAPTTTTITTTRSSSYACSNTNSTAPLVVVGAAHMAAYYSDDEIKELVRRLAEAQTLEEARDATVAIRCVLKDDNAAKKADAAQKLFRFQVVPTLVLKLQQYGHDSDALTEHAARILVQLTYFEPTAKQMITMKGGVSAVYDAAQNFVGDMYVSGNVTVLFSNLALTEETRDHVNLEPYMDYVLNHMKQFPDEPYTQRVCCKYLANIGVDHDELEKLFRKSAMPLVALALQNHRHDQGVRNVAKEALQMLIDHCEPNNHTQEQEQRLKVPNVDPMESD